MNDYYLIITLIIIALFDIVLFFSFLRCRKKMKETLEFMESIEQEVPAYADSQVFNKIKKMLK